MNCLSEVIERVVSDIINWYHNCTQSDYKVSTDNQNEHTERPQSAMLKKLCYRFFWPFRVLCGIFFYSVLFIAFLFNHKNID